MKRAGIYLRLSNEDKNSNDESESIKNQRNLLLKKIKSYNFVLADEYCDEDISGAGSYRPEFERLINDCKNGKLDVVLCKSQSRFSRDMEVIEKYLHNKFLEWNIRFIGVSDNVDTDDEKNKKTRQINGLVNEWFLEDVSKNIRSAFYSKMNAGELISGFAPFGYMISKENNNKLVIDPDASIIVSKIFNLYNDGYSFSNIANYLNENNIPSPSYYKYEKGIKLNIVSNKERCNIKWNCSSIKNILTNEVYIGNLVQGKRTTVSYKNHKIIKKEKSLWIKYENCHDAIVDVSLFNKVNTLIRERTRILKSTRRLHLFSGKVFCYRCGSIMRKKDSNNNCYLVCSNKYGSCINKKSIRYDELSCLIKNAINDKISVYYDEKIFTYNDYNSSKIKYYEKNKKILEEKLYKNNTYLINAYKDKVDKVIDEDQFNLILRNITSSVSKIKSLISNISSDIDKLKISNKLNDRSVFINELNRLTLTEFIDKIYIDLYDKDFNQRDIYIKWNFF